MQVLARTRMAMHRWWAFGGRLSISRRGGGNGRDLARVINGALLCAW
jgi:hypothetical protein